jgi:radical SAM superfamily enzyme YgiQ (UPF0313 family)
MIMNRRILALYVERIRAALPGVVIIVGGPLIWKSYKWLQLITESPSIANNEFVDMSMCDDFLFVGLHAPLGIDIFVVSPHGGQSLLQVLRRIEDGKDQFDDIPNLGLPTAKGSVCFTRRADEGVDYNSDVTRWDLLDRLPRAIPLTSSYGCPYRCGFCDFCALQPKLSMRRTESMATELRLIKSLLPSNPQVQSMVFTDDNVFISPRRVSEVCETLVESNINLLWSGFIRASSVTRENIGVIKRSLLMVPQIGVESGDADQLQRMMKRATPDQLKTGIELLDSIGAAVTFSFVVGYPGETEQTIANTAKFINSLDTRLASYMVFPFRVSPLSPVARPDNRQRFKLYGVGDHWRHATMDAEHTEEACKALCEQVSAVPYNYETETVMFNVRFMGDRLKRLQRLRTQMTVQVLEASAWDTVSETLACMAETMGLGKRYPAPSLRDQVVCLASGMSN